MTGGKSRAVWEMTVFKAIGFENVRGVGGALTATLVYILHFLGDQAFSCLHIA